MAHASEATATLMPCQPEELPRCCPACGGLECLCRPRFFPGQLLTDEDLNRLDHYIVEKAKLHNRNLHGWGVVCGLELACHPCDGYVTVTAGHALSPCGEDIVLCKDDAVAVCDLIQKCRQGKPVECDPPRHDNDDQACGGATEDWVLAVRYRENPSRGITPLLGAAAPCCTRCAGESCGCGGGCGQGGATTGGCGCGSKTAKSCGCGGKSAKSAAASMTAACPPAYSACETRSTRKGRGTPPQCEPTMVCESYSFEVYKAPPEDPEGDEDSAMEKRFDECIDPLLNALQPFPPQPTPQNLFSWCCRTRQTLINYLDTHPSTECALEHTLRELACPAPNDPDFNAKMNAALDVLAQVFVAILFHCICRTLLAPCPAPVTDDRVVLGTVTVTRKPCTIVRVCTWSGKRKFATSFPALQYWLSPLSFVRDLRQGIEWFCCQLLGLQKNQMAVPRNAVAGAPAAPFAGGPGEAAGFNFARREKLSRAQVLSTLALDAVLQRSSPFQPRNLFLDALGVADDDGQPFLKERERENLVPYLLFNQVLRPLAAAAVPPELAAALPGVRDEVAASGAAVLRAQLDEMREAMRRQEAELRTLKERLDGRG
jgi:hypothetical protein